MTIKIIPLRGYVLKYLTWLIIFITSLNWKLFQLQHNVIIFTTIILSTFSFPPVFFLRLENQELGNSGKPLAWGAPVACVLTFKSLGHPLQIFSHYSSINMQAWISQEIQQCAGKERKNCLQRNAEEYTIKNHKKNWKMFVERNSVTEKCLRSQEHRCVLTVLIFQKITF